MLFSKIPAYLIDSENVGSTWTSLLQNDERFELYICVTENAKSLNFTLLKELMDERRNKINIIECEPGKNSLDFYLSSFLGYLIGKNKHSAYVVVSQDTGYDHVIEYWNKEGYDVKRINTKPEPVKKSKTPRKKNEKKVEVKKEKKTEPKPEVKVDSEKRIIVKDMTREDKIKVETPAPVKKQTSGKKKAVRKEEKKPDETLDLLKSLLKDETEETIQDVKKYLDKVPEEKRNEKNYIYRGLVRKFKSEKGLAIYTLIKKELDRYYQSK